MVFELLLHSFGQTGGNALFSEPERAGRFFLPQKLTIYRIALGSKAL